MEGLASAGIGTYADTTSTEPERPVTGAVSTFRLLDFQAHALAVGAWSGSSFGGDELDVTLPTPTDSTVMPTTSEVLAAYVAAADSPGASMARAMMAGQNLLSPSTLRFPAAVMVLFVSDLSTDGGRISAGHGEPSGSIGLAVSDTVCSDSAAWITGTIDSLFNALKVATPASIPAAIIVSFWNWLVDQGESFVQGLISTVTGAVLSTVRSIAGVISSVAESIMSLVPYGVRVTAAGAGGGATFNLGPAPLTGTFTATVTIGDLPSVPAVLADCAKTADIPLPGTHPAGEPLIWEPLRAPADPLMAPTGSSVVTDADGKGDWGFMTSVDPGDANGEQRNQADYLPVTVHDPKVQAARDRLNKALLGSIPPILQGFVASLFAPYLNGLQARINALLDARGTGTAILIFHAKADPTPTPPPTPTSGPCSPSPVAPGTYKGTTTNVSKEVIDQGSFGGVVATDNGSGTAALTIAADGTVDGAWDMTSNDVFDETAVVDGVLGLKDHRVSTSQLTGSFSGTACDLQVTFLTNKVTSCTDTLKGDCSGDQPPASGTLPGGLGGPTSVAGGQDTWTYNISSSDGAVVTDTLTVTVSSAAP